MKKQELLHALEVVKPGLANKEIIEQSTSFAFINDRVVTYNDEISISHPVEGLNVTGAVQAQELHKLLTKLKVDDFEIEVTESEILIACGKSKAGMTLHQEIKLPLEEIGKLGKWKTLPVGFIEAVSKTVQSVSKDSSQPILTCIHINENGFVESSDSFRITRCNVCDKFPIGTFLLPASSAQVLLKTKPTKITEGNGWVHFKNEENTILSCRIFEDKFPDTANFLKVEGVSLEFPKTINDILDRASVFNTDSVELLIENNLIKIKGTSDAGWYKETAKVKYDAKEPIKILVNPNLLKNVLNETHIGIHNGNLIKFSADNWQYVAALQKA